MRKIILILSVLSIVFSQAGIAQWSTSTRTDSALYVCPGYYSGILTFDDGSSIILGALSGYIYAQKLDPKGYKMWSQPAMVFHNNNSAIGTSAYPPFWRWGGWVTDGDGGVIIFWYDYRDAYNTTTDYKNNATYIQRVDKYGIVRWDSTGVLVSGVQSGMKGAIMVDDGGGGCIIAWSENGFDYPNAPNIERIRMKRFGGDGTILWDLTTDTSLASGSLSIYSFQRFRNILIMERNINNKIFSINGDSLNIPPLNNYSEYINDGDSVLFQSIYLGNRLDTSNQNYLQFRTNAISANFGIIWSVNDEIKDEAGRLGYFTFQNPLIPDGLGGLFFVWGYADNNDKNFIRAMRINSYGDVWDTNKIYISNEYPAFLFGNPGELGICFESGRFQLFDSSGNIIVMSNSTILSDAGNAYFQNYASDNNGGLIVIFWTTTGGIYAQHSFGKTTGVIDRSVLAKDYSLRQNYPNPFNPVTTIRYIILKKSNVVLSIYNSLGQLIQLLVNEIQEPGEHSVRWNASNFSSGVYYYQIIAKDFVQTKKLILIK
ncbi:MAG: T9SS type A sorting domain-containing protein [Bacteroidota bacterium]